jgi:hypothetical protein
MTLANQQLWLKFLAVTWLVRHFSPPIFRPLLFFLRDLCELLFQNRIPGFEQKLAKVAKPATVAIAF